MRVVVLLAAFFLGCTQPGRPLGGNGPQRDQQTGAQVGGPADEVPVNSGANAGPANTGAANANGANSSGANPVAEAGNTVNQAAVMSNNMNPIGGAGNTQVVGAPTQSQSVNQSSQAPADGRPVSTGSRPDFGGTPTQPKAGGMCRRAVFGSAPVGLSLNGDDSGFFRPLTVLVELITKNGGATCTGFLYNQKHGFGEVGSDGKPVASDVRYMMLPRISLAKHCLQLQSDITRISFTFDSKGNKESVAYNVDSLTGKTIDGPWDLDLEAIRNSQRQPDKCSNEQKLFPDRKIACFTADADRTEIVTIVEAKARENAKAYNSTFALKREELDQYATRSILDYYPPKVGEIAWAKLFDEERANFVAPLNYKYDLLLPVEDMAFSQFYPKSIDDLYAHLDRRLEKISVVSTILPNSNANPIVEIVPRPGESWSNILEVRIGNDPNPTKLVYGEPNGVGYENGQSVNYFQVEAIGLRPEYAALGPGHSGTLLLAHWRRVSAPVLSFYTYRQILGVLSTVGGKDVCAGDDLTCCEKVQ